MDYFAVQHLDLDRLLTNWRWLWPKASALVARSAFGDLFLEGEDGTIWKLDVHGGEIGEIAKDRVIYEEGTRDPLLLEEWFSASDERTASERGLVPGPEQCIAFGIPIIFKQGSDAYIGDLYEAVAFLGDLHKQIHELPDGSEVRLIVKADPEVNPTE